MLIRSFAFSIATTCSLVCLGCGGSTPSPAAAQPTTPAVEPATTAASALADSARALAGSWRCSGAVYGPDGAASPSEVTLDARLDLDAAWLRTELAAVSGEHKYKFISYRTFHPSANRWVNVIVDNLRGHTVSRSTDGELWTGDSSGPMGEMKIRDTETIMSSGNLKMLGEYSLDGNAWSTGYDLSCKRAVTS